MNTTIVYTTSTCSYCPMVKKYLKSKNIEYEEVSLDDKPEVRQKLFEATQAMTVPITEHNGKYVIGWNPGALKELIS